MLRTYAHHFDDDRRCEAAGCNIRTRSLYRISVGLARACCPAHAAAAEREWTRRHIETTAAKPAAKEEVGR